MLNARFFARGKLETSRESGASYQCKTACRSLASSRLSRLPTFTQAKNTRAEAVMTRAYSSANFLNIVFAVEYELSSGKYVLSKETLHCAVSITNICTFVLVLLQLLTSTRMERRSTVGGSW